MSSFQERNVIPKNNSGGKCLLENWVEERATASLEPVDVNHEFTSTAQLLKNGHKGLLTLDFDASCESMTTIREAFQEPKFPGVRTRGKKEELMERMLLNKVISETVIDYNQPIPKTEFISVKQQDYDKPDFKPIIVPPTKDHNVNTEQCTTFWSTHSDKIHGVSQVKTRNTPFKKNSAFSMPISEYLDQTQPYDDEGYPNM